MPGLKTLKARRVPRDEWSQQRKDIYRSGILIQNHNELCLCECRTYIVLLTNVT